MEHRKEILKRNAMKGHTNNPNGRPRLSNDERRVLLSIKIKPAAIQWLNDEARRRGCYRSRVIEQLIDDAMK